MADFPKTLTRRRDAATRTVTTPAEQVAAEFDGFAELSSGQRAAVTRKATKSTAKRTAKKAATKTAAATRTTRDEKGPAAASPTTSTSTTTAKTAAATPSV